MTESQLTSYWNMGFSKPKDEGFYDFDRIPKVSKSSHFRRIELLEGLDVGNVGGYTAVDFGMGPWGFGCLYSRLRNCRRAIGIDISQVAVDKSRELSEKGQFPYGKNFDFLVSDGLELPLEDESVDLFFAGEAIEHVEHVNGFIDEVHRVLRKGGQFVLTTPNSDALVYKAMGERYCMSLEHVSLMSYDELVSQLAPAFEIAEEKGFNGSFYYGYDQLDYADEFADRWAREFEDSPGLGTGIILRCVKKPEYAPKKYRYDHCYHSDEIFQYQGSWEKRSVHGPFTASVASGNAGDQLAMSFEGDNIIVFLLCTGWSGHAVVSVDKDSRYVNLFSSMTGFQQVQFENLGPGTHRLMIRATGQKDRRSRASQVFFHKAIIFGAL